MTVRWLDDRYHGLLGREGPPEWPPSPFRLFQALVAGIARQGGLSSASQALEWLESLNAPIILAPPSRPGQIVQRFVPNNDGDAVPDRQDRLTGKTSQPTLMLDSPEIHYLWLVTSDCPRRRKRFGRRASCLVWGGGSIWHMGMAKSMNSRCR